MKKTLVDMVDENQFKTIEKEIAKGTFMGSFKDCIKARKRLRKSVTIALEKGITCKEILEMANAFSEEFCCLIEELCLEDGLV